MASATRSSCGPCRLVGAHAALLSADAVAGLDVLALRRSVLRGQQQLGERDGAIYLVHGGRLAEAMSGLFGAKAWFANEEFVSDSPVARLVPWTPARQTDRIVAQQGAFTVPLDVLADHGAAIQESLSSRGPDGSEINYQKLVVPAHLKPQLMLQLRYMNIAAHSLFPGADGVGRSVADVIRVGNQRARP